MRRSKSVVLRALSFLVATALAILVETPMALAAPPLHGRSHATFLPRIGGLRTPCSDTASTRSRSTPELVGWPCGARLVSHQDTLLANANRPATILFLVATALAALWHWRARRRRILDQNLVRNGPLSGALGPTLPVSSAASRALEKPLSIDPRLAALLEVFPGVAYLCTDDDHRTLTSWQGPLERLVGFSRQGFLSGERTLASLVHPDDALAVRTAIEAALVRGRPFQLVYRIVRADGRTRRIWEQGRAVPNATDSAERQLLDGVLLDLTDHDRAEVVVRHQAEQATFFDRLTGLPKRASFLDRLQQTMLRARSSLGRRFTLLYLDLDRFQLINASFGQATGDALLIEMARRLRIRFGNEPASRDPQAQIPCLARLEGDEFVVLVEDVPTKAAAVALANELLLELFRPFTHSRHELRPTASVGIVCGDPRYVRAEDVLRDAETAMYEAKRSGRSRCAVFTPALRERLLRRIKLEHDLWKAIEAQQLSLVYQPIVSLSTGALQGVEGLLRWQHPELGPIGPAEFIPLAEESPLILDLGQWVLEEGCRQLAEWTRTLGSAAPPLLSLNLSRKQFSCPQLLANIRSAVERAQLEPGRLQFEVTEDLLVSDLDAAVETMRDLKACGFHLAIDDFGKGYSSFASLHQFPVDVLKVDRSMIRGIDHSQDSAALLHALAVLAHNLGIHLVCEGIEEPGQVLALQELGGHYGQGYYFSPPLTVGALEAYLAAHPAADYSIGGAVAFANRWEDRLPSFHALGNEARTEPLPEVFPGSEPATVRLH